MASDDKVASSQTNFYIAEDTHQSSPCPPCVCDMCEEGQAGQATHFCQTCQQRMCRTCKRLHDKITKPQEHPVCPVGSEDTVCQQEKNPPTPKCPTHPQQDLCFLCKTCDVPVCLYCKMTSHQSHEAEDLTSAVLGGKRVHDVIATAREQIKVLEHSARRLSRDLKELARQKQEAREEVSARCDELLRWVNRSRDELLEVIEARSEAEAAGLRTEQQRASDPAESLSRLVLNISQTPDASLELWALKNQLQGLLLEEDALDRFKALGDSEERKTFLHLHSDPSALDLGMVRAYMGEVSPAGKKGTSLSLSEQVLEARQRADDLENRLKAAEQSLLQQQQNLQALQGRQDSTDMQLKEANGKIQTAETRLGKVQTRVAFNAWHSTNPLNVQGQGVLIMDHAPVNIGNAYDTSTGIFTVPVTGLYSLQATIMCNHTGAVKKVYAGLYIDGSTVYGMLVADSSHGFWDQSTVRAVVPLKQGQTICLKNLLTSPATYYSATGQPYTSFSGFLLQAD